MKAACIALALLASSPAWAQPRASYRERYAEAARIGDSFAAVEILREALADPSLTGAQRASALEALRVAEARLAAESVAPPAAAAASAPAPAPEPRPSPPPPAAPPPAERPAVIGAPARTWTPSAGPVALWSVGAASLAASVALSVASAEALGACEAQGRRAVCPTQADVDRARSGAPLATGASVALAFGLAAVVGGTGWWLLGGRAAAAPVAVPGGAALAVAGRW